MELLKLSKFKLQLRALITDVHELKKKKKFEEEFTWRIQQLETEIGALVDTRRKLERKVDFLQNDNALLQGKQKELKGAINNLFSANYMSIVKWI